MRNMSFALTTDQIRERSKTVTRRLGWLCLRNGDLVQAVKKCMGLKPGQKLERLCVIRVVGVTRVPLCAITPEDCAREGFPDMTPAEFVGFFCRTHKGCTPDSIVTRIEFTYPQSAN